ncbi:hypothetical protein VTN00DRAFT_2261 [Thermoascus crustaceus]|uniref:uncharacterized protein n=1 Tax=Thermoascus crustaceus TaxID=5088 RepID=UPI0037438156
MRICRDFGGLQRLFLRVKKVTLVEETSNNGDDDDDDGIEAGDLPFLPCLFVHLLFPFSRRQEDIFFLLLPFLSLFVIVIVSDLSLDLPRSSLLFGLCVFHGCISLLLCQTDR